MGNQSAPIRADAKGRRPDRAESAMLSRAAALAICLLYTRVVMNSLAAGDEVLLTDLASLVDAGSLSDSAPNSWRAIPYHSERFEGVMLGDGGGSNLPPIQLRLGQEGVFRIRDDEPRFAKVRQQIQWSHFDREGTADGPLIKIEPKDRIRKEHAGTSPDYADAFVLACRECLDEQHMFSSQGTPILSPYKSRGKRLPGSRRLA